MSHSDRFRRRAFRGAAALGLTVTMAAAMSAQTPPSPSPAPAAQSQGPILAPGEVLVPLKGGCAIVLGGEDSAWAKAKPEDIEGYRGAYERGWDHIRSERFARQVRDGLFPPGTEPAPGDVPWESLTDEQRDLFARYMEVYAAAVDNVDQNLARLLDELRALGEYENTIVVVASDNGGTGEGGPEGTRSYFSQFVQMAGLPADWERDVDRDPSLIGKDPGPIRAHFVPLGDAARP